MKYKQLFLMPLLLLALVAITLPTTSTVDADRDDKPREGSNGQCRKLQSSFPEDLQDYEGCHDTFTGKGHKDPEPLP